MMISRLDQRVEMGKGGVVVVVVESRCRWDGTGFSIVGRRCWRKWKKLAKV